jgi:hypothetical protein
MRATPETIWSVPAYLSYARGDKPMLAKYVTWVETTEGLPWRNVILIGVGLFVAVIGIVLLILASVRRR